MFKLNIMLRSYLRISFRGFRQLPLYTILSIVGLAAGFLVVFLDFIYLNLEYSYDRFHTKSERIGRLITARDDKPGAFVPYKWGDVLKQQWGEIEALATIQNITIALPIKHGEELYAQHGIIGADPDFFSIFDFPIVSGSKAQLLQTPDKIAITPATATKYFGNQNPIGQTLEISLWGKYVTFEVEGIVDCPRDSHLQFQIIVPMHYIKEYFFDPPAFESWTTRFAYTYILFKSENVFSDVQFTRSYLQNFLEENLGAQVANRYQPDVQPLQDIYLKSNLKFDFPPRGSIQNLKILMAVGLGILVMAVLNFVNVTFARYLKNIKAFGMKKILGGSRIHVMGQLILESMFISLFAAIIAGLLAVVLLPLFNDLVAKPLLPSDIVNFSNLLVLFGISLFVGFLAGTYPVIQLSTLHPANVLGSGAQADLSRGSFRKKLVVFQFTLAILLLVCTGVVYDQVDYMRQKDPGWNVDQVIAMSDVHVVASDVSRMRVFRNEMLTSAEVYAVSGSSSYPGQVTWGASYVPEGYQQSEKIAVSTIYVDHDFVKTYGLKLAAGRDYNKEISSDSTAFIINEEAAKLFASKHAPWLTDPIGRSISSLEFEGRVIGVLKNFHFESVSKKIEPLILQIQPENFFNIQMKFNAQETISVLSALESKWKRLFPDIPFTYEFVDQEFAKFLDADQRLRGILAVFACTSIMIAVLGLFGLTSFESYRRTKEMSIRKVVGASQVQIFELLTWNFIRLILIAYAIALPLSYYIIDEWLNTFAYRIDISLVVYVLALAVICLATLATVFYHANMVSKVNPVDALSIE